VKIPVQANRAVRIRGYYSMAKAANGLACCRAVNLGREYWLYFCRWINSRYLSKLVDIFGVFDDVLNLF